MVCLVVCAEGELSAGSYARSGRALPVRTADGAFGREKDLSVRGELGTWNVDPGFGDVGRDGKRVTLGFGDEGKPTRGVVDCSEAAEVGSGSVY